MEASVSDSELASTCQGSHCETDPRPKPKQTKVLGKAGAAVYRTQFNRAWSKNLSIYCWSESRSIQVLVHYLATNSL